MKSPVKDYKPLLKAALDTAKSNDVYAVARLQDARALSLSILDGKTESKVDLPTKGVGVSVFTKEGATAFASTSQLDEAEVRKAVGIAADLAKRSADYDNIKKNTEIFDAERSNISARQSTNYTLDSKSSNEVEAIVQRLNMETKKLDDRVTVKSMLLVNEHNWNIMRTDGTDVEYSMPCGVLFNVLTLKDGDNDDGDSDKKIAQVFYTIAAPDLGVVLDEENLELHRKRSKNHVQLLSDLVKAGTLQGGNYKALLSHSFGGLYVHEAVGHAFETDLMKSSIVGIEGKLRLGEKVAPDNISFIDGPLVDRWGNQFVSDNGIPRKTVEFIKNGVIVDALSDIFSAKDVGVGVNGCGRAESYAHLPICRMSATRMIDNNPIPFSKDYDDVTPEDLYELLVKHGELKAGETVVYPVVGMGGEVNPIDGSFMFGCAGIYSIEHPKKITLHRQAAFSGSTIKTLATRTRGIGDVIVKSAGTCGKGQNAPCSKGGNMFFLLDKNEYITFGGTQ